MRQPSGPSSKWVVHEEKVMGSNRKALFPVLCKALHRRTWVKWISLGWIDTRIHARAHPVTVRIGPHRVGAILTLRYRQSSQDVTVASSGLSYAEIAPKIRGLALKMGDNVTILER